MPRNSFIDLQIKSAHSGYRDHPIGIMNIQDKSSQLLKMKIIHA